MLNFQAFIVICTLYVVNVCPQQKLDLEDQLAEKELQCAQQHKETQRLAETLRRSNEAWTEEKEALKQVRTACTVYNGNICVVID